MLFDKDALAALYKKLKNNYPDFNIHVFLNLLQNTTRPLGYPPHREGVNSKYYLNLIKEGVAQAQSTKNPHQFESLRCSLYQLMICFCYFQQSLCLNQAFNKDLLPELEAAIEKRSYTTDEERCAEKSLLHMLFEHSREVLQLIAKYNHQLPFVKVPQTLKDLIKASSVRRLNEITGMEIT